MVDVLDQLESWASELYVQAGLCDPPDDGNHPPKPPIAAPFRPDQPASHVPPVPELDDYLPKVQIPCIGDQVTRVRLAGAKDLRAGCHTHPKTGLIIYTHSELWIGKLRGVFLRYEP